MKLSVFFTGSDQSDHFLQGVLISNFGQNNPQKLTILGTLVRHANCLSYQGGRFKPPLTDNILILSSGTYTYKENWIKHAVLAIKLVPYFILVLFGSSHQKKKNNNKKTTLEPSGKTF